MARLQCSNLPPRQVQVCRQVTTSNRRSIRGGGGFLDVHAVYVSVLQQLFGELIEQRSRRQRARSAAHLERQHRRDAQRALPCREQKDRLEHLAVGIFEAPRDFRVCRVSCTT